MSLKITTLIENMPDDAGILEFEHGFSVLIDQEGNRVQFDTGQTGAFVKNAEHLGLNLETLDAVVLSHGHYDHTGGMPTLLENLKRKTPFYIGREFFLPKYKRLEDDSYKYNGNPFPQELLMGKNSPAEVHIVEDDVIVLSKTMVLFKNFSRVTDFEKVNPKFYIKTDAGYEPDLFADEIALGIITENGLVLVVGCSHVGIVNILEHVKQKMNLPVAAVLGGTHLVEAEDVRLTKTVEALKGYNIKKIAVSHCTGEEGIKRLRKEFPEVFVLNNTGTEFI